MTTPHTAKYFFSAEMIVATDKVDEKTIASHEQRKGMKDFDPVVMMFDSLIFYAKAHNARYGSKLALDYILGPIWLGTIKNARGLLDGEGMFFTGTLEELYWAAGEIAGFSIEDLN